MGVSSFLARFRRELPAQPRYVAAPKDHRVYVVGDIHGRLDLLRALHARIDADRAAYPSAKTLEIYLGDYVDRGPASAGVIEALVTRATQVAAVFLRGNHEAIFQDFIDGTVAVEDWRPVGGGETLRSYGVKSSLSTDDARRLLLAGMPESHRAFLSGLRNLFRLGPYLFVHAGIRPGVAIERQAVNDLHWIRDEFLSHRGSFGYFVVHGHSPVMAAQFLPNRINIDTGAYMTGRLTCLRIAPEGVDLLGD